MRAMILDSVCGLSETDIPLRAAEIERPEPGSGEVLIKISACGVCHTELDEIEGRTPPPRFPMILGHEIVGTVAEKGPDTGERNKGDTVGIGWFYSSCGTCRYCLSGAENLCASRDRM